MKPPGTPDTQAGTEPAAVYLLQRHDGLRFKIGWAVEQMPRVRRLPEFLADELDLQASYAAWLPSPLRTRQIERSLHRGLATQRALPPHQLVGHTERFMPAAWRTALCMIRPMPAGSVTSLPPVLLPFGAAPKPLLEVAPPDAVGAVAVNARDVLWAMEDLLLRASALNPVHVEGQGEFRVILLNDVRGPRPA